MYLLSSIFAYQHFLADIRRLVSRTTRHGGT